MLRRVCDRCKKIIWAADNQDKRVCLVIKNFQDKDKDVDLCSKCFNLFNMFMSNGNNDPVVMSLTNDAFECPCCHARYVFEVNEERRIKVLHLASTIVEEGYIDRAFVNFNCTTCNQLLSIPESVLEEVNK